jgi:hypothetical protein
METTVERERLIEKFAGWAEATAVEYSRGIVDAYTREDWKQEAIVVRTNLRPNVL